MNVVLFIFDSLRQDHLSCYGYERETTPNLDQIAQEGVIFENAFSQAIWTTPSSGSILTSRYPKVHGADKFRRPLSEGSKPMAVPLEKLGYTTGCISTMDQISRVRDYNEGFDEFVELFHDHTPTGEEITHVTMSESAEWIREHADEDFFLFVWNSGTHSPFRARDEADFADSNGVQSIHTSDVAPPEQIRGLYDETIRHNDREFQQVVETMRSEGVFDKTLLVVTADHGEVFDEHGRFEFTREWLQSLLKRVVPDKIQKTNRLFDSYGWLGHQFCLPYEELLHVPLIMRFPDGEYGGRRVSELAQTIDIAPTILDYLGAPPFKPFQGRSLLPAIESGSQVNDYVYSTSSVVGNDLHYHSVRDDRYKYIHVENNLTNPYEFKHWPARSLLMFPMKLGNSEYLLDTRHGEQRDLKDDKTHIFRLLQENYRLWREQNDSVVEMDTESDEYQLDDDAKKRLKELGYLE